MGICWEYSSKQTDGSEGIAYSPLSGWILVVNFIRHKSKYLEKIMDKYPILNERLYLRSPSINVCFRLIIEGMYDKKTIEEALLKVYVRHPFLNCSVNIDNDNNAWMQTNFHKSKK